MNKIIVFTLLFMFSAAVHSQNNFTSDVIKTSEGDLTLSFIGHGTLMFEFNGKTIHIDPWSRLADYSSLPKADLVLITHEHGDHLDLKAIEAVTKEGSIIVMTQTCLDNLENYNGAEVMANGDKKTFAGFSIEALPAYNVIHKRNNGQPFHPKGSGNGYIITFGDQKVLVAGDTENIPEIKSLKGITIAFLPMNLPYTMTPEMVADAAKAFRPKILYPYHFGNSDTDALITLLKNDSEIEVRIRNLK